MGQVIWSVLSILAVIYIVPFVVYGSLSAVGWVEKPKGSPSAFLLGVLVSKTGTSIAFVLLLNLGRSAFGGNWPLYAFLWWVMFVLGEIGQAMGPNYSYKEAVAGVISETVYFPLASYLAFRFIS